jgi:hypothetical protein
MVAKEALPPPGLPKTDVFDEAATFAKDDPPAADPKTGAPAELMLGKLVDPKAGAAPNAEEDVGLFPNMLMVLQKKLYLDNKPFLPLMRQIHHPFYRYYGITSLVPLNATDHNHLYIDIEILHHCCQNMKKEA